MEQCEVSMSTLTTHLYDHFLRCYVRIDPGSGKHFLSRPSEDLMNADMLVAHPADADFFLAIRALVVSSFCPLCFPIPALEPVS